MSGSMVFHDRTEVGQALAARLQEMSLTDPVVLALPRGGVPIGYEIARVLRAPLDVILVRKIGAPGHEEFGIGAVVDGATPQTVIDEVTARMTGASPEYIERKVAEELALIEQRRTAYRTGPPVPLRNRTAILVDDGIATGNTAQVALKALASASPARTVLAVPVAARDTLDLLKPMCDDIVCLAVPEPFHAVGAHYRDFSQTCDAEVVNLLKLANDHMASEAQS